MMRREHTGSLVGSEELGSGGAAVEAMTMSSRNGSSMTIGLFQPFLAALEGSQTVLHLGTFVSDTWQGVCINDN